MQNELNEQTVRYTPVSEEEPLDRALSKYHNKKAIECHVKRTPISLQDSKTEKSTISVEIVAEGVRIRTIYEFPATRFTWKSILFFSAYRWTTSPVIMSVFSRPTERISSTVLSSGWSV